MPFHLSRITYGAVLAILLAATLIACSQQPEPQPTPNPTTAVAVPTPPTATVEPTTTVAPIPTATTAPAPTPESTVAAPAPPSEATQSATAFVLGEGTVARYKVEEVLASQGFKVATGETSELVGRIVFDADGAIVADESSIVIQAGTLKTDNDRRDRYVREQTLQTANYPEIIFHPTAAEGLPSPLSEASGEVEFALSGDLTIRDQTRPVIWNVTAEFDGSITGLAVIDIDFEQFGMDKPSVAVVVSVGDTIRLELDFVGTVEQTAAMSTGGDDSDTEPDPADEAYAQLLGDADAPVTVVEFSDFQ
jgi:polyisoprenoid-binding protein YceI